MRNQWRFPCSRLPTLYVWDDAEAWAGEYASESMSAATLLANAMLDDVCSTLHAASASMAPDHVSLTESPSESSAALRPVSAVMAWDAGFFVVHVAVADHAPAPVPSFFRARSQYFVPGSRPVTVATWDDEPMRGSVRSSDPISP